jgi:hypothetical protein
MNKKLIYIIGAVAGLSLFFNFTTMRKVNALKNEIMMQNSNAQSSLNWIQSTMNMMPGNVSNSIKSILDEQASIIYNKSHAIISYNSEEKSSDVKVNVVLKEMEQGAKLYLKEVRNGFTNKVLMDPDGGLSYSANRTYIITEPVNLSIIIEGSVIKEEYLFDFNLKEKLENRIYFTGGGSSMEYANNGKLSSYQQDFSFINNHENDTALKLEKIEAKLEIDGETSFVKELSTFNDSQQGTEYFNVNVDIPIEFDKDVDILFTVTAHDRLGLTYEYINSYIILKDGNITDIIFDKSNYYEFKLKQ